MNFENVIKNLNKKGFKAVAFSTSKEAKEYLVKEIYNVSVGFGGSITLKELELFDLLEQNNKVWWHGKGKQLKEFGSDFVMEKATTSDVYVTSANAISEQGQIINIDGRCNRIASTLFGHKKVYFIVGKNKIAPSFEEAMWRARNIAAPKNAQRLNKKTPCAVKGDKCYDCTSPDRICRGFLTLEMPPMGSEVEVIIIDENLGY